MHILDITIWFFLMCLYLLVISGIFNFNISNYDYIGIDNEYSNTITKSNVYIGHIVLFMLMT